MKTPEEIMIEGGPKVKKDYRRHRKYWLSDQIKKRSYTSGAELGVQYGFTFMHLLEDNPELTLYGIDHWISKADKSVEESGESLNKDMYDYLLEQTKPYSTRAHLIRKTTDDAALDIPDETLDFVFIDAGHSYNNVAKDIKNWRVKLRKGGMLAGHDINVAFVRTAVTTYYPTYKEGFDNCWYIINE